ncbi:MAG TPA: hypothetical protein VFJ19_09320 [Nocardioidaceae bacterium]|nr:hypothetical protein [Nocardioidaceae bacterium]
MLAEEMAYCGPRGIPHSHFLGGPAVWTDLDRDKALAWAALDRRTCRECGTRPEEWNPEQGGQVRPVDYAVVICPGCEAKQRTVRQARDLGSVPGLQVLAYRKG